MQFLQPESTPHPVITTGNRGGIAEPLIPCTDWKAADYRYPNPVPEWRWKHAIACRLTLTGKAVKWQHGAYWRTGRLTWIGDCEPDQTMPCSIRCHPDGTPYTLERHEVR